MTRVRERQFGVVGFARLFEIFSQVIDRLVGLTVADEGDAEIAALHHVLRAKLAQSLQYADRTRPIVALEINRL
jgi:hypothetical protein